MECSSLLSIPQIFCFPVSKSCVFLTRSPSFPLRFKMKLGGCLPGLSVSCKDHLPTSLSQRCQEKESGLVGMESMCVCVLSHVQLCDSGLWPARLLCRWDSLGKNTGVGCHFLLPEVFPAQVLNEHLPCLLHCKWILHLLSHQGSPGKE